MTNSMEDAAAIASRFINNTNRHVFLTGKAGTGKTTFLRSIIVQTHKNAIVAAPTGIAAINAGGVTLHSLFQLPFGTFIPTNKLPSAGSIGIQLNTPDSLLRNMQMHATKRKLLREMELLIIDEVSMLRADLLDAIDVILRAVRRNRSQPFGGVQVLFIGDLFQLPPVVKQEEWEFLKQYYPDVYFFSARALQNRQPVYIELDKIYRQADDAFIRILNHLRENKITREDIDALNKRYNPDFHAEAGDGYIYLTTHNRKADTINRDELGKLPGSLFTYYADIEGDFGEYQYPVDAVLDLKEGAQVMFIKNDYSGDQRYFNGKIGTISSLSEEEIRVSFNDGQPDFAVERYIWENKKYTLSNESNEIEEKIAGTYSHFPLKLAWAITVHKSQGLTFEKAIIDVSSAFAPGQTYVALSRLVSLDGLVLSARVPFSGPAQEEALSHFVEDNLNGPPAIDLLPLEVRNFIRDSVLKSFDFSSLLNTLHYFTESHDKDETRSAKQKQKKWAENIESDFKELKVTADKFLDQLNRILRFADENYLTLLSARLEAARGYFEPLIIDFSDRVKKQIRRMEDERKAKAYQSELNDLERLFFKQRQAVYKSEELIRAAIQDEEFSKEKLLATSLYAGRGRQEREELRGVKEVKGAKKVKKDKSVKKEKKERSDKISLDMFLDGKSIKEIAAERVLAVSTIESHLLPAVSNGLIDISRVVEAGMVARVLELSKDLDTTALSPLKERLGAEVSYGELRFIMAHKLREEARRDAGEGEGSPLSRG